MSENSSDEIRDQLPSDLDVSAFVGPYQFPDNRRRRIPGYLYLGISACSIALWIFNDQSSGLVNDGILVF